MGKSKKSTALALVAALTVTAAPLTPVQAATVTNLKKAAVTTKLTVGKGYKQKIAATSIPSKTKITYTSKNKKVATVNSKGTVKGVKVGTTTITVKLTYNKKSVTKKCKVTVKAAVKKVAVKKSSVSVKVGKTSQITTTVTPAKALQSVTYTSKNKKIATVTSKGKIKGIKAGTTTITVKAKDGSAKKATVKVTVTKDTPATAAPTVAATETPVPATIQTPGVTPTPTPLVTVGPKEDTPAPVATATPDTVPATAAPTVAPTVAPTETPLQIKTITKDDITDGKVKVEGTYDKVVIKNSVGNAEITLDSLTVKDTLTLEGGADYTVNVEEANIKNVEIAEVEAVPTVAPASVRKFDAAKKQPKLKLGKKTVIEAVKAAADVIITGEVTDAIESLTITKAAAIVIEIPVKVIGISAPKASLAVSSRAKVGTIRVEAAAQGAAVSVAGSVESIQTEAKETAVEVAKDAEVKEVQVTETAEGTALKVEGSVESIQTDAKETAVEVGKEATVKELQVTEAAESTKLTVEGNVDSIKTDAKSTAVEVAKDATIGSVETTGEGTSITGSGTVKEIDVKGNDTKIEGVTSGSVKVDESASGTTVGGKDVAGGTETTSSGSTSGGNGSAGGSTSGGNTSGGSSSGGGSGSSGGNSGSSGGSGSGIQTPTPQVTATTGTKTFKKEDAAPKFKVTYKNGQVSVYTFNKDDVEKYVLGNADGVGYTVEKYNETAGTAKTTSGTAKMKQGNKLTSATITVDEFTCDAQIKGIGTAEKTCEVEVTTTSSDVDSISFVTNYVKKIYEYNSQSVTLTADNTVYTITREQLKALYHANVSDTDKIEVEYTKTVGGTQTTTEKAELKKLSLSKGTFVLDGKITCEVYVDPTGNSGDAKAYVTASTNEKFATFKLN